MTDNVKPTQADNPERIWLSPICVDDPQQGDCRTWAAPAPESQCEECGEPWVEYVRSDLTTIATQAIQAAEIARLSREVEQARFEPLGDNHHNAAECPHCRPSLEADKAEIARLREALERIATVDMGGGFLGAQACRNVARAALSAQPDDQREVGS